MANTINQYQEIYDELTLRDLCWLSDVREICPEFLGPRYSNPYYATIPKGWLDASTRILVVGEEGFGTRGMLKNTYAPNYIERLHQENWQILASNLYPDDVDQYDLFPDACYEGRIRSPFWNAMRKISQYGICAWTNQDRIHLLHDKNCSLSDDERDRLHSIPSRLLHDEIEILNPTHVFLFGFYRRSIQHELPEVFDLLQPGGYDDQSRWYKNVVDIPYEGRHYLFAYHPGWWSRGRGRPQDYAQRVMETFRASLG